MKDIKLNPDLRINKVKIPGTSLYVVIVDEFLLDTSSVMNFAHNIAYFNPMFSDNSFYPGIRDNMPLPYMRLLKSFFEDRIITKNNSQNDTVSSFHKCLLSLTTCQPSQLTTEQKLPHIDSFDERDYAFVHYLSGEELGGTSLYRYKPENLIQFTEEYQPILAKMFTDIKNSPEDHEGYITSSTSVFEQVLKIDAKFNRLVIYQGNLLHSANLISKESYNNDPKTGRLSIASFASIK
ncbi:DUF6445 family protein [Shewanella violacea]|uniref:Uncharacterized protein n=1 Tax=Shewanella violacea (strain JCM 10179 / CIP 106290 / LMG 19151 / DSS12) TaxID=637905 RepID=D4ZH43_SHEVD|nr:DUF6445 family protein [Shewanella violacea]BAJ00992.1 hypothetical protein SVI_1021 [Shewanella violacea DSS12]